MRHGREIRTFARLKGGSETIAPISLLPPTRVSVRSLMVPLSIMFAPETLKDVRAPAMIYVAGNDRVLSH